jgi:hypothetical protein
VELDQRDRLPTGEGGRASRRRLILIAVTAIVLGVLVALRLLHTWRSGGRVPKPALLYFGVTCLAGGLLQLSPPVWRWMHRGSTWSRKRVIFGKLPPRDELPGWRRALQDLEDWLIEREHRRREMKLRDPRRYQLRDSAVAISAGLTILVYALVA